MATRNGQEAIEGRVEMKFSIIGITGPARSGKDTVADELLRCGAGLYRYAFADPIRAMLKAGLGIDMADPWWQGHKEDMIDRYGCSARRLMQTLGTEWGRNLICSDIWLGVAEEQFAERGPGMVISDVRFDNEAAWVRKLGGLVLHVRRPGATAVEAHASEAGVEFDARDHAISNDGTLERLRGKASLFARLLQLPAAS
jgi:hypothetical protein